MLHQLMWECCWSLTANKYYVYGSGYDSSSFSAIHRPHNSPCLTHWDMTTLLIRPTCQLLECFPQAPFILSPQPCRCWRGGPCGRRAQWESYSSCQVPPGRLRLWSGSKHSRPSRMICCCHSTWTDGEVTEENICFSFRGKVYTE